MINKKVKTSEYEPLRERIIHDLSGISHPESGEKLLKWICKREDLYQGQYISKYPDIVFTLSDGYGVGWDIYTSMVGRSSMSSFQPGSHKRNSPIFLVDNMNNENSNMNIETLMDIKRFILDCLI
jgi:hypothetical protein